MSKRKNYSGGFKAKVALEALRGDKTLSELSSKYGVHGTRHHLPNLVTKWKKQSVEGLGKVFSGKFVKPDASHEAEVKELQAKIGQLTMERDFLSKAFGR